MSFSEFHMQKPEKFELYRSLMLESYYPIKQIAKKVASPFRQRSFGGIRYYPGQSRMTSHLRG
jgi:hypothetical protein